jgi:tetratricopeptide (TPR) repeat protein
MGIVHTVYLAYLRAHPAEWPSTILFYCGFIAVMIVAIALTLSERESSRDTNTMVSRRKSILLPLAICLFGLASLAVFFTNIKPIQADINYKYAQDLRKKGKLQHAVHLLEVASRKASHRTVYWAALGRSYQDLALTASKENQMNWYQKGERVLRRSLKEAPFEPEHYLNMGRFHFQQALSSEGSSQKALLALAWDFFSKAARLSPENIFIFNDWAGWMEAVGELPRAEELYAKSMALNADYGPTYLRAGRLSLERGKWRQAVRLYRRATELMPQLVEAHSGLGYALIQHEDIDGAIQAYRKAVALSPQNYNDYKNLGLALKQKGLYEEAHHALQKALTLAPEEMRTQLNQAIKGLETKQPQ